MTLHFPLSKENFMRLYLPNSLINIWEYNDEKHIIVNSEICSKYEEWCIETAKSHWKPEFKSFAFVISQIQIQNKNFFDFGNLSSATRNLCYSAITRTNNVYKYVY